jgi:hypothetical protein
MLTQIAPNLWHMERGFTAAGLPVSSRMTVVRFDDGRLWLHSPVRFDEAVADQLRALGTVSWIVAPNRAHHLFAKHAQRMFPQAVLYGAPGLAAKRPDLAGLIELGDTVPPEWQHELDQAVIRGMPFVNEVVWFHKATQTLIMTDVRAKLDVPRTVRLVTRDKAKAAGSARIILQWPFTRVITAHNSIVEQDAHAAVEKAFKHFGA